MPFGLGPAVRAVLNDRDAVDQHVADAGGILVRTLKGGMVLNPSRIEDDDIGKVLFFEKAAAV